MKILGIIPARGGSKGVPGKNIKLLGDKPLIQYSIESAKKSVLLTEFIVSTDDEEIATVSIQLGAEVPFLRPASLATDDAASIDAVIHALEMLEKQGRLYEAVCLLQPTSPFRPAGFIDVSIDKFVKNNYDSLISVLPVPHQFNPHWTFEPDDNQELNIATGDKEIIKRRQDLPPAFFRDGGIYITKTEILKKMRSLYGDHIGFITSDPEFNVNIDTYDDWILAESKLKQIVSVI